MVLVKADPQTVGLLIYVEVKLVQETLAPETANLQAFVAAWMEQASSECS
jgi:hypothetical protein